MFQPRICKQIKRQFLISFLPPLVFSVTCIVKLVFSEGQDALIRMSSWPFGILYKGSYVCSSIKFFLELKSCSGSFWPPASSVAASLFTLVNSSYTCRLTVSTGGLAFSLISLYLELSSEVFSTHLSYSCRLLFPPIQSLGLLTKVSAPDRPSLMLQHRLADPGCFHNST